MCSGLIELVVAARFRNVCPCDAPIHRNVHRYKRGTFVIQTDGQRWVIA